MDGQNTTGLSQVVEQDVDVEALEKEIGAKAKPSANGSKHISRAEFLFAAKGYKPVVEVVEFEITDVATGEKQEREIKVRELRAGERDRYENKLVKGRLGNQKVDVTEMRIPMVIASAVEWDDETTPLFVEKDADILRLMGVSVIQKIYNVCRKLSDVSDEDEKELAGESTARRGDKPAT